MPEHPYQEVSLPEWNAAPFDAALDPPVNAQDLVFTGACPRCDHPMTFRRPISVAVGLRDAGADDAKEAIEALREAGMLRGPQSADVKIICTCGKSHPKAPAGATGCGAAWVKHAEWTE